MFKFFKNVWESGWKNKLTLIFGAVVIVGAVVGVVYGVSCQ